MSPSEQEIVSSSLPAPVAGLEPVWWRRWRQPGSAASGPRAETFLDRYPQLRNETEVAVRIIYEEVCLRQESGEEVDAAEVCTAFPSGPAAGDPARLP